MDGRSRAQRQQDGEPLAPLTTKVGLQVPRHAAHGLPDRRAAALHRPADGRGAPAPRHLAARVEKVHAHRQGRARGRAGLAWRTPQAHRHHRRFPATVRAAARSAATRRPWPCAAPGNDQGHRLLSARRRLPDRPLCRCPGREADRTVLARPAALRSDRRAERGAPPARAQVRAHRVAVQRHWGAGAGHRQGLRRSQARRARRSVGSLFSRRNGGSRCLPDGAPPRDDPLHSQRSVRGAVPGSSLSRGCRHVTDRPRAQEDRGCWLRALRCCRGDDKGRRGWRESARDACQGVAP